MKTELLLDHATILANKARSIHFALRFTADEVAVAARRPAAFCVVLDRSGSRRRPSGPTDTTGNPT